MMVGVDSRVPEGKYGLVNLGDTSQEELRTNPPADFFELPSKPSKAEGFIPVYETQLEIEEWARERGVESLLVLVNQADVFALPVADLLSFPPPEQVRNRLSFQGFLNEYSPHRR